MRRGVCCVAVLFAAVFLVARDSAAQNSIAGVVKDTTGAFMPGVTVEVASPALIEKVRSAVSDGTGNYRIVDLPPGIYSVTFTLTGFRTVVRQDIQLQGNFTAQVNADLQIGALEETLTVTGTSPTVDVINNQSSVVLDRDVLDAIPTTARNLPMRAALIPGSSVTFVTLGQYAMTIQFRLRGHGHWPGASVSLYRPQFAVCDTLSAHGRHHHGFDAAGAGSPDLHHRAARRTDRCTDHCHCRWRPRLGHDRQRRHQQPQSAARAPHRSGQRRPPCSEVGCHHRG
jgi:hypothetical protein